MNDTPGMTPIPPDPAAGSTPASQAPTAPVPAAAPAPKMMKSGSAILLSLAMLVVGAVGGYFIGHSGSSGSSGPKTLSDAIAQYRDGKLPAGNTANGFPFGGGNGGGNGGNGGAAANGPRVGARLGALGVAGRVKSVSGDVVTIANARGNDVKVTITPSTTITKTVTGSKSDLTPGTNVRVATTNNSGGANATSVTARSIAEVPAGSAGGGAFFGGGGGGFGGGRFRTNGGNGGTAQGQ
ncbi:MAG TPA: hypothetical protein VIC35_00875 [Acidimicrobiia bacterium]|jgi:hypothetical protein